MSHSAEHSAEQSSRPDAPLEPGEQPEQQADPALAAILRQAVADEAARVFTYPGTYDFGSGDPAEQRPADALAAELGRRAEEVVLGFAYGIETEAIIVATRARGADALELLDAYGRVLARMNDPDPRIRPFALRDREAWKISNLPGHHGGEGLPTHVYAAGDVLYVVLASSDALAADVISRLPRATEVTPSPSSGAP